MKALKWLGFVLFAYVAVFASSFASKTSQHELRADIKAAELQTETVLSELPEPRKPGPETSRFRLDASRSKFIARALAGGLLWFKGHDHLIAVREFTGEAQLDPNSPAASSLEIVAKAASMEETSSVFTEAQKKIINTELREIVLLPDQYPDIIFRSTSVSGKEAGTGHYELKIAGNLTLLGVTRPVTIPTKVTVSGNELRAQGDFSIDRGDFKVKATSAFHGLVRVRNKVKFEFDIIGRHF